MKNLKLLILIALVPLLASCTNAISNPDVQTLSDKAVQLMNEGDIKGAISRLESINDLNPNFPQNHYNLGIAYYKNEEYQKSIDSLKRAIELDKNITDAYYTIALDYRQLSDETVEILASPDKIKSVTDESGKSFSKEQLIALNTEYLNNAKDYFSQYLKKTEDSTEKERIALEIESINEELNNAKN